MEERGRHDGQQGFVGEKLDRCPAKVVSSLWMLSQVPFIL